MDQTRTNDPIERELVLVRWNDACHDIDEHSIEQLGGLAELCECGWLIKETDDSVTVSVEHQTDMQSARLWITIPRCNIVELRRNRSEKAFPRSTVDRSYTPRPVRKRRKSDKS